MAKRTKLFCWRSHEMLPPTKNKRNTKKTPILQQYFEIWQKGIEEPFYKEQLQAFFDDTTEIIRDSSYKFSTSCC